MKMTKNVLLVLCAALLAAAPAPRTATGFNFSDWNVQTGEFNSNYLTGAFSTPGHVRLQRPGSEIQADRSSGNWKSHQALLSGNVWLRDQNGVLTNFSSGTVSSHQPATLTCDTLQIDGVGKIYTAVGHVHFAQGASSVTADRAIMNGLTHDLHLFGNVTMHT
jgi:lipopolysaccharide assembly outer membrane protein LptD (OstA)